MSALLTLAIVAIAIGAVGDGLRGTSRMLSSILRSFLSPHTGQRRGQSTRTANRRGGAIILIAIGAVFAVVTVFSRNEGVATFAAVMLGIGLPLLTVDIYRGLGMQQPPLYTWVIVAGIIVSPFGLLGWPSALISGEIVAAGLLLLWFDRKDKIMDTYGDGNNNTAEVRYSRLRRTALVLAGLAAIVVLTALSASFIWIWPILGGVIAVFFMMKKVRKMKQAKEEEAAARAAEVERILNTKVAGLDYEDDELLNKYMNDAAPTPVELRKGERRSVEGASMDVRLTGASPGGDVDCYVFLLDGHSKVYSDRDLIFFGQKQSPDSSVKVIDGPSGPGADISLSKVPPVVQRIAVAFALGEDAPPQATWRGGTVTVQTGEETYTYPVEADGKTRAVSVLRLYRHNGEWRLWVTDHRSMRGITMLCDEYGVDVA